MRCRGSRACEIPSFPKQRCRALAETIQSLFARKQEEPYATMSCSSADDPNHERRSCQKITIIITILLLRLFSRCPRQCPHAPPPNHRLHTSACGLLDTMPTTPCRGVVVRSAMSLQYQKIPREASRRNGCGWLFPGQRSKSYRNDYDCSHGAWGRRYSHQRGSCQRLRPVSLSRSSKGPCNSHQHGSCQRLRRLSWR